MRHLRKTGETVDIEKLTSFSQNASDSICLRDELARWKQVRHSETNDFRHFAANYPMWLPSPTNVNIVFIFYDSIWYFVWDRCPWQTMKSSLHQSKPQQDKRFLCQGNMNQKCWLSTNKPA